MTMRQIVAKLQSQGHSVSFYVRKDGGILIKSIDGEKFTTGASGNNRAKQILGVETSEARLHQLKYATDRRSSIRKSGRFKLDEEIESEYQRVKKIWQKHIKSKNGKPHSAGYFGHGRIEYSLKHYGREEALRRISEAERYATGYAYTKNVKLLLFQVQDYAIKSGSEEIAQLARDLEENLYSIREEWIFPAYEALYKLDKGVPPQEVARNTRRILRL